MPGPPLSGSPDALPVQGDRERSPVRAEPGSPDADPLTGAKHAWVKV